MKKQIATLLLMMPLTIALSSCKKRSNIKVHELQPYLFVTDTYREMDHAYADEYYKNTYDNWGGGGCTAISKMIDGHRLVGRNMDLNISNNCAFIIPAETGTYKTIGLSYTFRDMAPKYNDVRANGLEEGFGKLLPFLCDDVLNEAGLHIELNMRHAEYWPNGDDKFACEGTNPEAERRVHMFEIPRLVGENCKTVAEAIDYLSTLDVYSKNHYWNYSFVISDALNGAALVEFCMDQMMVLGEHEIPLYNNFIAKVEDDPYEIKAIGQANFYVNYAPYVMQDTKTGIGRFLTLQENIDGVTSKDDLFKLMDKISYSWFYQDYDLCKNEHFDPRSEQIGEFKGATYDFIMNPEYEDIIRKIMNTYSEPIRKITDRQVKRDKNAYWESTFTEVVDCTEKSIFIRFFEDYDMMYNITFDGIEKVTYRP